MSLMLLDYLDFTVSDIGLTRVLRLSDFVFHGKVLQCDSRLI